MNKRRYTILLGIILGTMILAACTAAPSGEIVKQSDESKPAAEVSTVAETVAEEQPAQTPAFSITDALEREIAFDAPPERIVLAGRAVIMVADAMYLFPEASERLIAISKISQGEGNFTKTIDPNYDEKEVLDHNIGPEQVAAARPDLVILKSFMAETLGNPLDELGIPVVYVDFETQQQFYRDVRVLGQIFQNEKRAEEVIDFYAQKVDQITTTLPDLLEDQKPDILLLYYSDKDGEIAFNIPPISWIQTSLVEMAGGNPVWRDAEMGKGWTKVNLEQIAAWDPDQIHIISYFVKSKQVVAGLKEDPQWQALKAVQNDQLYAFPSDYYSWDQPDTRWILGLTYLAAQINPGVYPDLDMDAEVSDFYEKLYVMDEQQIDDLIMSVLQGTLP